MTYQSHNQKKSFSGQQVQSVREECGRILAEESSIDADIVSTVPDSATAASIGFAEKVP